MGVETIARRAREGMNRIFRNAFGDWITRDVYGIGLAAATMIAPESQEDFLLYASEYVAKDPAAYTRLVGVRNAINHGPYRRYYGKEDNLELYVHFRDGGTLPQGPGIEGEERLNTAFFRAMRDRPQ